MSIRKEGKRVKRSAGFTRVILWWGEMAPLPKKSPDLGNRSPAPGALMYNRASYGPP
jgi:hypothetical protein